MSNGKIYCFIYKQNHNKCLMLKYIVLYTNTIIIKCLLIITIMNNYQISYLERKKINCIKYSSALHRLSDLTQFQKMPFKIELGSLDFDMILEPPFGCW
jgi:hypothetical protein